jgi:hypothetical protein
MTEGIRIWRNLITPAPGVWYFDGVDSGGTTMSIVVFKWVSSADGQGVEPSPAVRRFNGFCEDEASLCQKAERLCRELDNDPNIAHCSDPQVRVNVAKADSTSTEVLSDLCDDQNARVRTRVAMHKRADPQMLHKLSTDSDPGVRAAVAWNPNTPWQVLLALEEDQIGSVVSAAKRSKEFRAN